MMYKTYTITTDTLNGTFDQTALDDQMRQSSVLSGKYDSINHNQGNSTFDVYLVVDRTTELDTEIDSIVSLHDGQPLEEAAQLVRLSEEDTDTGGVHITPKFAPSGWKQQLFETEIETSVFDSIHEKNWKNEDIGWSVIKLWKSDGQGGEVECADQADADVNCIRTDLEWMPDKDYMIKGGWVGQITPPAQNVYAWAQAAVLPEIYGVPPITFAEGGLNMAYIPGQSRAGLDGVAGTIMYYSHPQLGPGIGTNKLRFTLRHSAGFKHRFQMIMDIFSE